MRTFNPITKEPGCCIAVARASVGIYFALRGEVFPQEGWVIVPANLCYAGIYPVLYAGLKPMFCDVDPFSGNITLDTFSAAYTKNVVAAIVPHMYGNPVEQMAGIVDFCKDNHILLIEDCASAMGASAEAYLPGSMGDYVVYSTGYSKTLDLGFGGFLFSRSRDLSYTEKLEAELPELTEKNEQNMAFFSKLYRLIRNEGKGTAIEQMIFSRLAECCRDDFLHSISREKKEWLFLQLEQLPDVIEARRQGLRLYEEKLKECSFLRYPYQKAAAPWRYNLLLEEAVRKKLIQSCLEDRIPVSDWYPRVTNLFGNTGLFPGAEKHESMILNFPLLLSKAEIERICEKIRFFTDGHQWEA